VNTEKIADTIIARHFDARPHESLARRNMKLHSITMPMNNIDVVIPDAFKSRNILPSSTTDVSKQKVAIESSVALQRNVASVFFFSLDLLFLADIDNMHNTFRHCLNNLLTKHTLLAACLASA
jgi:hypothetical protein